MMDLELEALNALPEAKRRQLSWLFECRRYVASVGCELWCFGMTDLQPVDRHIVELEESIADLIVDPDLTVVLMAEYVVADAARVHQRGRPPVDFDCSVCRTGYYGIDQMLARLPDRPGSIDLDL